MRFPVKEGSSVDINDILSYNHQLIRIKIIYIKKVDVNEDKATFSYAEGHLCSSAWKIIVSRARNSNSEITQLTHPMAYLYHRKIYV